jgi:hypothetical protein
LSARRTTVGASGAAAQRAAEQRSSQRTLEAARALLARETSFSGRAIPSGFLNAALTFGQVHSHRDRGWEFFTDRVVDLVHDKRHRSVFCLWGELAKRKAPLIDK